MGARVRAPACPEDNIVADRPADCVADVFADNFADGFADGTDAGSAP